MNPSSVPASLHVATLSNGKVTMAFSGDWLLNAEGIPNLDKALQIARDARTVSIELVAEQLGKWDSALLATMLLVAEVCRERNISCGIDTLPDGAKNLLRLGLAVPPNAEAKRTAKKSSFLEKIGSFTLSVPQTVHNITTFIGEITLSFARLFTGRAACSGRDIWRQVQECGDEALPITTLISLLVGLILAFVGVVQLRMFGAEIYVSSLVAVGMTRIMGAIMTGIILAGRTGASFAAVIGTMQVNEEIDALVTQGIAPSDFLVLPRIIALSLMTPLLVLYADFAGMFGGFLVGVVALGLDPLEYITFTRVGFGLNNLWVGLAHGFVFGLVIAITGCYQGLRCGRSAASVGNATTAAVVFSIVGIVIATAILTILSNILHI